jgi:hypothetical protein
MKTKLLISILFALGNLFAVGQSVPNTTTFTLQNVCDAINPSTEDLVDCFSDAIPVYFNPAYSGSKNSLLNFKDYGPHNASTVPTVTTTAPYDAYYVTSWVNYNRVVYGGNVTTDGGSSVTARGTVYSSTDATPTIGESGVTNVGNGSGTGAFSNNVQGLTPGTLYYFRAYATNTNGTAYCSVQSYTTCTKPSNYTYALNLQRGITINGVYTDFYTSLAAAQQACYDVNNPSGRTITMTAASVLTPSSSYTLAVNDYAIYNWGDNACNYAVDGYYLRLYDPGTDYIITVSNRVITAITACP